MTDADADTELVEVHLLGLPLALLARAVEHSDELTREFSHVAEADSDSVPARLTALSQQLQGRYGAFTVPVQERIDAATARGDEAVDVTFRVPPSAADAASQLWALLDEADAYCRAGDLLTLAPPPEVLMLRRWYLSQFIDQIRGSEPVSFADFAAARRA